MNSSNLVDEESLRNIKKQIEQMRKDPRIITLKGEQRPDIERILNNAVELGEERLKRERPELVLKYETLEKDERLAYLVSIFPDSKSSSYDVMIERAKVDLKPLLFRVLSSKFAQEIKEIKDPTVFAQIDNVCVSARMVLTSAGDEGASKKERTILRLNHYKTEVESIFTFQVNLLVLALILDGREYYRGKKRIKLATMKQIRKETLSNKLQFLSLSGLGYFTDACNRAVRNSFSHESYEIADDGSFTYWFGGKRVVVSQSNLMDMIETINSACSALNRTIFEITTQWIEEKIDEALENIQINKLNHNNF